MVVRESIVESWQRQVRERPSDPALHWRSETLTFEDLAVSAGVFAGWLRDQGVRRGDVVANLLPRSAAAIAVQLGTLLAGAAHLAIDPKGPVERRSTMLADARPKVVVDPAGWDRVFSTGSPGFVAPEVCGDDVAYVVYTSGSSGKPKGVVVEHRSLANLLAEHESAIFPLARRGKDRPLRVSHGISLSFDAAWDPLLWLVAGHEVHLLDDEVRADAALLDRAIADAGLDVVEVTPALAEQLVRRGLLRAPHAPSLLLMGGEAVSQGLWTELASAPATVAVNLYGPSECTVFTTWARMDRFAGPVIGHPVTGTTCSVLDAAGTEVTDGIAGELVVRGASVARGYHDRPEETAARFGTDASGARTYRTGDIVRRAAGGALEFLGRADTQVKIRGHRIELGEVEAALLAHPGVLHAVVKTRDEDDRRDLVGFVVVGSHHAPGPAELLTHIASRLPAVMVPAVIAVVDEFPLTSHGKVDRAALGVPRRAASAESFEEPDGPLERTIADQFRLVLGSPPVGRTDSFFELGGHSLLATVVAENLRRAGIACRLHTIMENPRVCDLAAALASDSHTNENVKEAV
ncbi:non-ribosomal peptide synthetase [Amycolatopsis sp. WQ 127309]|uniref:non-ribosomal peptide synthetase n=1 Tax=Amycolatopsis sp. WQ 127309 TaxID=2932773 RepID=UPI001FF465E5|nr:non-ribosomal peptide synthetase [Amycolatopsis sp. WQ 127309]UOZ06907.1 non-ribosomal peptide synthetase [Amycolatopsis sp. WQ 127309]